jgi:hypothetical protein
VLKSPTIMHTISGQKSKNPEGEDSMKTAPNIEFFPAISISKILLVRPVLNDELNADD